MNGKVCIVTGASSGIGRAAAALFAKNNARVVAVGRNVEELKKLQTKAQAAGGNVTIQIADVSDSAQIEKLISDTADAFGQIDVLVNAAGIILNGSIENTTLGDWDEMMNINLPAVFLMARQCVPHLEKTKGNVVNVSSVAGLRSFPNVLASASLKRRLTN